MNFCMPYDLFLTSVFCREKGGGGGVGLWLGQFARPARYFSLVTGLLMERKSSKENSVVFLVEGKEFKLRICLWGVGSAANSVGTTLEFTAFAAVLTPSLVELAPSSETQGQLVGTTGFSWAKVYNKSGRAPGTYSYRFSSRSVWILSFWLTRKIFFWPISDSHVFGRLSCLLTRGCFPHRSP